MYKIENKSDIFVEHYTGWKKVYTIERIGNEEDLIAYLANGFKPSVFGSDFDDVCRFNSYFEKHYFDGYGRDITATAYKTDAWVYYCLYIRNNDNVDKNEYSYWWKKHNYHNVFRQDPVPHTGKRLRGGPPVRPRRIRHIKAMYGNPEYKEFNRGTKKEVPDGWWDDWYRHNEKNWKFQSKRRHQWKPK